MITTEIFIKRAVQKHGDKYDYSKANYITQYENIIIICPIHGEFLMEPRNHLRSNSGCPKCKINSKLTNEEFIIKAKQKHGNKYDYTNINYINKHSVLDIICPIHGEFKQKAKWHLESYGCQKCGWKAVGDSKRFKNDKFITKSLEIHTNKYDYSNVIYINAHNKVKIICSIHGEFEQTPSNHLKGQGCSKCKSSKGEKIIREFLLINNIKYLPQHRFNGCKDKIMLPFDFYLPDYNVCIEYNGEQHYRSIKYWGGLDNLKSIRKRDKIKKRYCYINSIPLIIIRYNEDIIKKLEKKLLNNVKS
jgi:hypothetical protein